MKNFLKNSIVFLVVFSLVFLCSCKKEKELSRELVNIADIEVPVSTNEITDREIGPYKAKEPENSQVGIVVDSWMKIVSIGETDGVVSIVIRNISETDIQHALLSVNCADEVLKFPMTTIPAGSTSILKSDRPVAFDKKSSYYNWKIEEKTFFTSEISLYPEIFEIMCCDKLISVKNISGENINGDIFVYYKSIENGIFSEGTTYRVRINGLGSNQKTQVDAEHFKASGSKVMFVTYAQ